jgi:hypothetical protein
MTIINAITSKYIKQLSDDGANDYQEKTGINIHDQETSIQEMQDFLDDNLASFQYPKTHGMIAINFAGSNDSLNLSANQMIDQLPSALEITPFDLVQEIKKALANREESITLTYYSKYHNQIEVICWLKVQLLEAGGQYQVAYLLDNESDDEKDWDFFGGKWDLANDSLDIWLLAYALTELCIEDIEKI